MEPSAIPVSQARSGAGPVAPVFSYDISLNRAGPNTVELPCVPVIAVAGFPLILEFTNYGKPLHLTVSSGTIAPYAAKFSLENLYIEYREKLTIPISPEAQSGEFTLDIITGYGARRESLRVTVQDASSLPFQEPEYGYSRFRAFRITPGPVLIAMGIILYAAWFFFLRSDLLSAVAFLVLLLGALYPWYLRL